MNLESLANSIRRNELEREYQKRTKVAVDKLFDAGLISASYWEQTGSLLQKASKEKKNNRDNTSPQTLEDWNREAAREGLPKAVPVSGWALQEIESGWLGLQKAIWTPRMMEQVEAIVRNASGAEPGAYSPVFFQGPPGTFKTEAHRLAAALLGRPLTYVRGDPGVLASVRVKLLDGGTMPMEKSREETMSERAWHGIWERESNRLAYWREISNEIDLNEENWRSDELWDAHRRISRDFWKELADKEGLPKEETMSYQHVGLTEMGRRNGAFIFFDEINRWQGIALDKIETYLRNDGKSYVANLMFGAAGNDGIDGVTAPMHHSLLSRLTYRYVAPLTAEDYQQFAEAKLGILNRRNLKFVLPGEGEISVVTFLEERGKFLGLPTWMVERVVDSYHSKKTWMTKFTPESGKWVCKNLGQLIADLHEQTKHDGALSISGNAPGYDNPTVDVRTLHKIISHFHAGLRGYAVKEGLCGIGGGQEIDFDKIPKQIFVSKLIESIRTVVVDPYKNVPSSDNVLGEGKDATYLGEIVEQIIKNNRITAQDLLDKLVPQEKEKEQEKQVKKNKPHRPEVDAIAQITDKYPISPEQLIDHLAEHSIKPASIRNWAVQGKDNSITIIYEGQPSESIIARNSEAVDPIQIMAIIEQDKLNNKDVGVYAAPNGGGNWTIFYTSESTIKAVRVNEEQMKKWVYALNSSDGQSVPSPTAPGNASPQLVAPHRVKIIKAISIQSQAEVELERPSPSKVTEQHETSKNRAIQAR